MKFLNYIHYFLYLSSNWNLRIALHILINDIKGEKKYGIHTTGIDDLKKTGQDISTASIYMPVSYDLLEDIFTHLPLSPREHFLDIGCGRGRAMCVAAENNYKKISGIDFSKKLCKEALANASIMMQKKDSPSFDVHVANAATYSIPSDVDCIFMFNPFNDIIMKNVIENILTSIQKRKRDVYIVYVNPLHKDLFIQKAFTEIYYSKRLKYLEVSILKIA
ncbi:MAG: class I SAM-dependent methyltransferase [Bacteroidota bacterium]